MAAALQALLCCGRDEAVFAQSRAWDDYQPCDSLKGACRELNAREDQKKEVVYS